MRLTSPLLLQPLLPSLPLSLLPPPMSAVTALCSPRILPVSHAIASSGLRLLPPALWKIVVTSASIDPRGRDRSACSPSTAKRTGRAYLSVIEGGTASFAPARRHNFAWLRSIENGRSYPA